MEKNILKCETECTGDAERDAISVILVVLRDLSPKRAIGVLEYLAKRYKDGDTFGK